MRDFEFSAEEGFLPERKTKLAAGFDLSSTDTVDIEPFTGVIVGTGVSIVKCPDDVFFLAEIRSGLRVSCGLTTLGSGIIDADYRGEIKILLYNVFKRPCTITRGDRIAQIVPVRTILTDQIGERTGGFGSTGKQ